MYKIIGLLSLKKLTDGFGCMFSNAHKLRRLLAFLYIL